jgi:hypothetical protein
MALCAVVVAGLVFLVTAPAQATVGGCSPNWSGNGYNIGVCINDRGTTTMAFPDIYVNTSAGTANCSILIEVWNDSSTNFSHKQVSCAKGHYLGYATGPFWGATNVHSFARLLLNGQSIGTFDSPTIAVSTHGKVLYDYDFPVTVRLGSVGVGISGHYSDAFAELHRCFNCSFPISGAPSAYPADDQYIALSACPFFSICNAPVRVYTDEAVGDFMSVAQPGHFDTAGSTVRFHFATDSNGILHLQVKAFVLGSQLPDPANQLGARNAWSGFAGGLGRNLYNRCGGTHCS